MSDTVGTIVQIAQLPISALILVGLYLLIVKLFPAVIAHFGKQLEAQGKQAEATMQMAQATMKVVEIGAGLSLATTSISEMTKAFQSGMAAYVKTGEMVQQLIEQNNQQMESNRKEHKTLMVLARSQSEAISGLPCQTLGQRACPDNSEEP